MLTGYEGMSIEETRAIELEYDEQINKDLKVLALVKESTTHKTYSLICNEIKDSGRVLDFSIVSDPVGEAQCENWEFGDRYVDQSVGYLGDDYSGTVCISFSKSKYFKFNFSM